MQVRVRVSRDFLELVEKNVLSSRPAGRVNASSIDNTADAALLIADHSLFSGTYFIPLLTIIWILLRFKIYDWLSKIQSSIHISCTDVLMKHLQQDGCLLFLFALDEQSPLFIKVFEFAVLISLSLQLSLTTAQWVASRLFFSVIHNLTLG
jgi:hypothetical protein